MTEELYPEIAEKLRRRLKNGGPDRPKGEEYAGDHIFDLLPAPATPPPEPGDAFEGAQPQSSPLRLLKSTSEEETLVPVSLGELSDRYPQLREPVIHGLLRRGETMNVISASKVGKSWMVVDLALSAATGGCWLGTFQAEPMKVLIIDNELHCETIADRIRKVANARNIPFDVVREAVFIQPLRGRLRDFFSLKSYFRGLEKGRFGIVVVDAFYRMLPSGTSENDNAAMAEVYNALDGYADHLGSCFANIHHASKGDQSEKATTDVGAGAGSMSRAADTHMILRPHEDEDVFVLDVALRSWAPVESSCLKWTFPVWEPVNGFNPKLLRRPEDKRLQARKEAQGKEDDGALLAELDRQDPNREGCGVRKLRYALAWTYDRMNNAVARTVARGVVELCQVLVTTGRGREQTCDGIRRVTPK